MLNVGLTAVGRALAVALALGGAPAAADPPAARGAEEAARRAFGDWRLHCAAGDCAIRTVLRAADGTVVLSLAVEGRGDAARLVLGTPLPLHLPDGVALGLGDAPPRPIAWRTCDARGCEAEAPLEDALLAALRRERAAEVALTLEDGVRVRLVASLMGFTAARAAQEAATPP